MSAQEPKSIFNMADLRSVVTVTLIGALLLILGVVLKMSYEGRIPLSGQIDVGTVMGFVIAAISASIGWLFGKQKQT